MIKDADRDGNGELDEGELRDMLMKPSLPRPLNEAEFQKWFEEMNPGGGKTMLLPDLAKMMVAKRLVKADLKAQAAAKAKAAAEADAEVAKQEAAKREAVKQEAAKQEAAKQDAAKLEAERQETAKQDAELTDVETVLMKEGVAMFLKADLGSRGGSTHHAKLSKSDAAAAIFGRGRHRSSLKTTFGFTGDDAFQIWFSDLEPSTGGTGQGSGGGKAVMMSQKEVHDWLLMLHRHPSREVSVKSEAADLVFQEEAEEVKATATAAAAAAAAGGDTSAASSTPPAAASSAGKMRVNKGELHS